MTMTKVTGPGARERLREELRSPSQIDPRVARKQAADEARAKVDASPLFAAMREAASRYMNQGQAHHAQVGVEKAERKPDRFKVWHEEAEEAFAQALLDGTSEIRGLAGKVKEAFPHPGLARPVTAVDQLRLSHRLTQLYQATPQQAVILIQDAIRAGDRPMLTDAKLSIQSWTGSRNAWSNRDAVSVANRLVGQIEEALFDPAQVAAEYAAQKADEHVGAWRYMANLLMDGGGVFDAVHQQTGALAPLLDK